MSIRITIACPSEMIADANQFALCIGNTAADSSTFTTATWENEAGRSFALASLLASETFPKVATSDLVAPAYASDLDLEAAKRAQAALQIWSVHSPLKVPELTASGLVAIVGLEAALAVPLLGLSPVAIYE